MKLLLFLVIVSLSYAMDLSRVKLEGEKLKKARIIKDEDVTGKTEKYSAQIVDKDGTSEYTATKFLQGDDKGQKKVCIYTKIGTDGKEQSTSLHELFFDQLKSLYEEQNKKN